MSTSTTPDKRAETGDPKFGNYTLVRHIGSGGMAEVDLGRVEGPGGVEKLVVVKRVRPEYADTPIYAQMFLDEARIAAALQHPNIIQVHDVGKVGDQLYIAMEYLRGKNLAEILMAATEVKHHLPLDFAIGVVCCVCDGLHYAHQMTTWEGQRMSIVHRDVSPDNIFVSYDGHIKLVDFGLAKSQTRTTETRAGVVKGTVGYLAPEHFQTADIDRRLDVFSAGVILWEMITGRRLFEAATTRAAWDELQQKAVPSPSQFRPECSVALEAVIRRALHKDPDQRYQSARALLIDLERVAESSQLWLSPTRRSEFMEKLFPGRTTRYVDVTMPNRRPTPLPTSRHRAAAPDGNPLDYALSLVRQQPLTAVISIALLLLMTFVLGIALAVSSSDPPAAPKVVVPAAVDMESLEAAKRAPKRKKPARKKRPPRQR